MTVSFLVVGSSLAIWAHLLRVAYRRRDFTRIVTPTWDGLTKIGSMTSAANSITFALNSVGNLFSGKIGASPIKVTGALTILAAMVLLPGVLIALVLVRHFAHTSESRIEAYAQNGFVHT